jgi:hypothetical protein
MRLVRASRFAVGVLLAGSAIGLVRSSVTEAGDDPQVGINVVLSKAVSTSILSDLGKYGKVLDVIPEIRGVTMRAREAALSTIQGLSYVAAADVDASLEGAGTDALPVSDLSAGSNQWCLDAINVTDAGVGRVVDYDGEGTYIAVLDTGLPQNWRAYFPEERIATDLARAFTGGGGEAATISSQPDKWSKDQAGHGQTIVSVILGFAYQGPDDTMPEYFNGVAPKATVIPIRFGGDNDSGRWESLMAQCIVYAANLKVNGTIGDAPLVINLSNGLHRPLPLERAAIDYAIDHGVIVVAAAGNEAERGMRYPAQYPEVISVAASGWTKQFPESDETSYRWILDDVPEDGSEMIIAPFSSRELDGQTLDVAAPGFPVPIAYTANGKVDYSFTGGTSQATPCVVGVAAMMLQKNPNLTQTDVVDILTSTARPIAPGTATIRWPLTKKVGEGNTPVWGDIKTVSWTSLTTTWDTDATGAGLLQADAALAATPNP